MTIEMGRRLLCPAGMPTRDAGRDTTDVDFVVLENVMRLASIATASPPLLELLPTLDGDSPRRPQDVARTIPLSGPDGWQIGPNYRGRLYVVATYCSSAASASSSMPCFSP